MGINDLNKLIKQKAPNAKKQIKMSDFAGTRIAIDSHIYAYKLMSRSNKTNTTAFNILLDPSGSTDQYKRDADWFRFFIEIGNTFSSMGIVPVFVFDGTAIPEKKETQQARKDERKKMYDRMKVLEEKLSQQNLSERSDDDINELIKLRSNIIFISKELLESLKDLLLSMGFPVITGRSEGEKLCVMLCLSGECSATYSADTDCIALNCPILLHSYFGSGNRLNFDATIYDEVLTDLNLNESEFLDLCIMAGSDFSTSLPGNRILSIYKAMCKLEPGTRNVENVISLLRKNPKLRDKITEEAVNNLDYENCRSNRIFGRERAIDVISPEYNGVMPHLDIDISAMNTDHIKEKMESLGVGDIYHLTRSAYKNINKNHNYKGGAEKILKKGVVVGRTGKINFVMTDLSTKNEKPKEQIKVIGVDFSLINLKKDMGGKDFVFSESVTKNEIKDDCNFVSSIKKPADPKERKVFM